MADHKIFGPNPRGVIEHDHNHDGIDRRGFLKCMAWAGTGALCLVEGGVLKSYALGAHGSAAKAASGNVELRSDQRQPHGIQQAGESRRDRHLKAAVDKINALPPA